MEAVVDRLRDAYAALGRGESGAALAMLAPDCEWHESDELPGAGALRGREAVGAFLESFLESWDRFDQRIESVRIAGDRVVLQIHLRAVGRASGLELDTRYAHVWTIADGLGARVDAYRDPAEVPAELREGSSAPTSPSASATDQNAT